MLDTEQTRKSFLATLGAFASMLILSSLPFSVLTKDVATSSASSGNTSYGGAKK